MAETLKTTHTKTYNTIQPANPFLVCAQCGQRVEYWLDKTPLRNEPCGHEAGYENLCPSWGPADGCCCQDHLGYVPHAPVAGQGKAEPK